MVVDWEKTIAVVLCLAVASAPIGLGDNVYFPKAPNLSYGGGGGSDDRYTTRNNTIIVDNTSSDPVVGGSFVLGEVGNIFITNLTNSTTYDLIDPEGTEIGETTAANNEVRYYHVEIDIYGTWEVYVSDALDLLGAEADPVVTFNITEDYGDAEPGTTVEQIPSGEFPSLHPDSPQPCSYIVENGVAYREGDYENHSVNISGEEWVEVRMNWTVRETADDTDSSEFLMQGWGEMTETMWRKTRGVEFIPTVADVERGPGQDGMTTIIKMNETETYNVECNGNGPDQSAQSLVRGSDSSYVEAK